MYVCVQMMCCGVTGYSDYLPLGRISIDKNAVSLHPSPPSKTFTHARLVFI